MKKCNSMIGSTIGTDILALDSMNFTSLSWPEKLNRYSTECFLCISVSFYVFNPLSLIIMQNDLFCVKGNSDWAWWYSFMMLWKPQKTIAITDRLTKEIQLAKTEIWHNCIFTLLLEIIKNNNFNHILCIVI